MQCLKIYKDCAKKVFVTKKREFGNKKENSKPWFTINCQEKRRNYVTARNLYNRNKNIANRGVMRSQQVIQKRDVQGYAKRTNKIKEQNKTIEK